MYSVKFPFFGKKISCANKKSLKEGPRERTVTTKRTPPKQVWKALNKMPSCARGYSPTAAVLRLTTEVNFDVAFLNLHYYTLYLKETITSYDRNLKICLYKTTKFLFSSPSPSRTFRHLCELLSFRVH